jgi:hypothetical protein
VKQRKLYLILTIITSCETKAEWWHTVGRHWLSGRPDGAGDLCIAGRSCRLDMYINLDAGKMQ